MNRVLLDLNNPEFQKQWFDLPREEAQAVLATLHKIRQLTWPQLYSDPGLRWEAIHVRRGPHGARLYSLRITKRIRAVATREGDILRLLALHRDHDSAYQ
jgi:hypothetical protein